MLMIWGWVQTKIRCLEGGLSQKKQCSGGNCLKKGASTFGRFKVELAKKRGGGGGVVFLWGDLYPNAHYAGNIKF